MKLFKRIFIALIIVLAIVIFYNYPKLNFINGFAAKNLASTHFISHRDYNDILENDNNMPLIKLADLEKVKGSSVTASVYSLVPRTSICRDGLGCALVTEDYNPEIKLPSPKRTFLKNDLAFPYGNNGIKDSVFANVDYDRVDRAIKKILANYETQMTRTVMVVYKDHIISEEYIEGFSAETPILGWSMTKSVLATLYGILDYQDEIDINEPAPIQAWQNDERKNITLNHLLRMQSGLEWEEDYASISDVNKMLFMTADMPSAQLNKMAIAPPTEIWNYSSGTTNLLSGILRDHFNTHQEYVNYPYEALIDKIGMNSMLLEADIAGNFVGSSYGWATTRDWAKFGLLYLHRGNWNGKQIFAPEWVDYVTKPTMNSDGVYGAHFWLNAGGKYPDVPRDMYSVNGFQGQRVYIIPSKDLVVVRTGLGQEPLFDANSLLSELSEAIN
ncbi:serine hydrolase [Aurantibacter crassamenti]|uniref:serine hydrolase domain-containing protein n=1 Tax=Aurantibacter crassamenti TaxID=1837375 RepID=UPI001939F66B|nr:serine hydrolase [Aurantibacter crassamenti]MBM1107102.1 serine hydrolase [Aurantibacter crassamenti]